MDLIEDVKAALRASRQGAAILNLGAFDTFPELAGRLFAQISGNAAVGSTVQSVYAADRTLVEATTYDIAETARRNFEPGGAAATLLFARGAHAVMAHRVAHKIWADGDTTLALAIKASCARVLSTDIHPATQIGAGFWLDHGLGFVAGETSVIEEDVSIWHNVTLGSTLNTGGARRHPHICTGVVIGAGATILGEVTIGANANISAGAIVLEDVPKGMRALATKATVRGTARLSFLSTKGSNQ